MVSNLFLALVRPLNRKKANPRVTGGGVVRAVRLTSSRQMAECLHPAVLCSLDPPNNKEQDARGAAQTDGSPRLRQQVPRQLSQAEHGGARGGLRGEHPPLRSGRLHGRAWSPSSTASAWQLLDSNRIYGVYFFITIGECVRNTVRV